MKTGSFNTALAGTEMFPQYMVNMATIGEETGKLDEVMESLAIHYEREDQLIRSIRNTISYLSSWQE